MANSRWRAARWNTIAALIVLSPMFQVALAQFANNPFFDHAEALGIAHGIEMLDIRLAALAAADDPAEEEIEAALRKDFPRFKGSLSGQDPSFALELEESLEALLERVEDEDKSFEEAVQAARELTSRARDLIVPADLLRRPRFQRPC